MDHLHACTTLKDEGEYLPEWIVYHRLLGVEHFHIYDNGSKVDPAQLVELLGRSDITISYTKGHAQQVAAYNDCLSHVRGKATWLIFCDLDEFIVPVEVDSIRSLLMDFENDSYAALCIHWQCFGSGGHLVKGPGLQMERFLLRAPVDWPWWNWHVKSIVRPERISSMVGPHHGACLPDFFPVNERHKDVNWPFSSPASTQKVQINHYFTRSREEFLDKISRGGGMGNNKSLKHFEQVDTASVERDERALRFLGKVKAQLSALGFSLLRK